MDWLTTDKIPIGNLIKALVDFLNKRDQGFFHLRSSRGSIRS